MLNVLMQLAQYSSDLDYSYTRSELTGAEAAGLGAVIAATLIPMLLIGVAVYVFMAFCLMKIFKKAGRQDAWAAWIPIYNTWVMAEVVGRPGWWGLAPLLGVVPFIGGVAAIVIQVILAIDLAKSFGKDVGYGILIALLPIVGYPMLAFGQDQYVGPAAATQGGAPTNTPPAPTNTPPAPTQQ